ncbi:unnamed protein product [Ectocarpus sp. 13 AM-2016]
MRGLWSRLRHAFNTSTSLAEKKITKRTYTQGNGENNKSRCCKSGRFYPTREHEPFRPTKPAPGRQRRDSYVWRSETHAKRSNHLLTARASQDTCFGEGIVIGRRKP